MIDFSKVKLVVSDMDGTLLNSKNEVSQQFFDLFKELQKHNVFFCAASGRQHNSIVEKLASIKDDIYVIAENAAISKKGENILLLNSLESEKIIKIIPLLRNIKRANMVLCSQNSAFIESTDQHFIDLFQEYYHSFEVVDDLMKIAKTIPVLKIAIYHFDSRPLSIHQVSIVLRDPLLFLGRGFPPSAAAFALLRRVDPRHREQLLLFRQFLH